MPDEIGKNTDEGQDNNCSVNISRCSSFAGQTLAGLRVVGNNTKSSSRSPSSLSSLSSRFKDRDARASLYSTYSTTTVDDDVSILPYNGYDSK